MHQPLRTHPAWYLRRETVDHGRSHIYAHAGCRRVTTQLLIQTIVPRARDLSDVHVGSARTCISAGLRKLGNIVVRQYYVLCGCFA